MKPLLLCLLLAGAATAALPPHYSAATVSTGKLATVASLKWRFYKAPEKPITAQCFFAQKTSDGRIIAAPTSTALTELNGEAKFSGPPKAEGWIIRVMDGETVIRVFSNQQHLESLARTSKDTFDKLCK